MRGPCLLCSLILLVQACCGVDVGCGNLVLDAAEQCDDGNLVDGDGCSALCVLEDGYMCYGYVQYSNKTFLLNLTDMQRIESAERCIGSSICKASTVAIDSAVSLRANMPEGLYCGVFCKDHLVVSEGVSKKAGDECVVRDVDECASTSTRCHANSHCKNKNALLDVSGYTCVCNSEYFTTTSSECSARGVEFVLFVKETLTDHAVLEEELYREDVRMIRNALVSAMAAELSLFPGEAVWAVLQSSNVFAPEILVRDDGSRVWSLKIRVAFESLVRTDLSMDFSVLDGVVRAASAGRYCMSTRSVCSNDSKRFCVQHSECLTGGTCHFDQADYDTFVFQYAGSHNVQAAPAGMSIISVDYDIYELAWAARVRFDNTVPNTLDILYTSFVPFTDSLKALNTFSATSFVCQNQYTDNTVCCLQTLRELYTTTLDYATYVRNTSLPLGAALGHEGACEPEPPPDPTDRLLHTETDFVQGPLHRMLRSYAKIDPVKTVGYKDVIVFLAEEDVRRLGGIVTNTADGFSVRFFIGMAHIRPLSVNRLSTVFVQAEVRATIAESFTFTASSKTDSTFIDDVAVALVLIDNAQFAVVRMTLPSSDHLDKYVMTDSLVARVGYSEDTTASALYPCRGNDTDSVNAFLHTHSEAGCSYIRSVCNPEVQEREVSFVLPLYTRAWGDEEDIFVENLFLSYVVSIIDTSGKRVLSTVKTKTPLTGHTVLCGNTITPKPVSLGDHISVDIFLGLTPSLQLFNESLVQALDITRSTSGAVLRREVSSIEANMMTMLIRGDDALFADPRTSIHVEDMLTVRILDVQKKTQIERMMREGSAFITSSSGRRLVPSDDLLSMCPRHIINGLTGCITVAQVQERVVQGIVDMSPLGNGSHHAHDMYDRTGAWLQTNTQQTDFWYHLGYNHSRVIHEKYALDGRSRRGFMISPSMRWREEDLKASPFEMAQVSITVVLVSFERHTDSLRHTAAVYPRRVMLQDDGQPIENADPRFEHVIDSIDNSAIVQDLTCSVLFPGQFCATVTLQVNLDDATCALPPAVIIAEKTGVFLDFFVASSGGMIESLVILDVYCEPSASSARRRLMQERGPALLTGAVGSSVLDSNTSTLTLKMDPAAMSALGVVGVQMGGGGRVLVENELMPTQNPPVADATPVVLGLACALLLLYCAFPNVYSLVCVMIDGMYAAEVHGEYEEFQPIPFEFA